MAKDCQLSLSGIPPSMPLKIPLNTGWNIIGFPRQSTTDAQAVTQQLIDRHTLIKVQDDTGNSLEDLGAGYGGWINHIGNFNPGEGYKVKVSGNDTLTLFDTYAKSAAKRPPVSPVFHFHSVVEGNGVNHMNNNLGDIPAGLLKEGDEIGIFDEAVCAGRMLLVTEIFQVHYQL
jgi:hypothetical protein